MRSLIPTKTCKPLLWCPLALVLLISTGVAAQDYFPLAKGNMWVYTMKRESYWVDDTCFISKDTVIQGELWYKYEFALSSYIYLSKKGNALLVYSPYEETPPICTLLVLPLEINREWDSSPGFRTQVMSKDTVSVSAGKFPCYKLKWEWKDIEAEPTFTWIAPGVGIVKQQQGGDRVRILKYYRLK